MATVFYKISKITDVNDNRLRVGANVQIKSRDGKWYDAKIVEKQNNRLTVQYKEETKQNETIPINRIISEQSLRWKL